jgi:hypothetical protein
MATGYEDLGVLRTVTPRVLQFMSFWVFCADGIFWGMAMHAVHSALWICVVEALGVSAALAVLSMWQILSVLASLIAAGIFGALIYSFCGLAGFAVVVAIQVGLMHYCAFLVVSKVVAPLRSRL